LNKREEESFSTMVSAEYLCSSSNFKGFVDFDVFFICLCKGESADFALDKK